MASSLVSFSSPLLKFLLMLYECKNLTFKVCLVSGTLYFHFVCGLHAYSFVQVELVGGLCGLGMTDLLPLNSKKID